MRPIPPHTPAAEVCLLLRSHAEARWLALPTGLRTMTEYSAPTVGSVILADC